MKTIKKSDRGQAAIVNSIFAVVAASLVMMVTLYVVFQFQTPLSAATASNTVARLSAGNISSYYYIGVGLLAVGLMVMAGFAIVAAIMVMMKRRQG